MSYPIFSVMDAKSAVSADFSGYDGEYVIQNYMQVYYACNTWFGILKDYGVPIGFLVPLADVIKHIGLRPVCSACVDTAESMLEDMGRVALTGDHRFRRYLTSYVLAPIADILDFLQESVAQTTEEAARICLQCLLYLERFTYIGGADEEASIKKFLGVNDHCRELEYNWDVWPGSTLITMMRQALSEVLTCQDWYLDISDCGFSTGSVLEAMSTKPADPANKSTLGKWLYFTRYASNVYGVEYPLPSGRWGLRQFRRPVLTLVPKSFTTRRVIFPEDVPVSFYGHGYLGSLRRMLRKNGSMSFINEQDQSVNLELARVGSISGEWATIDLSSASDSISKALVFACVPEWIKPVLLEISSWEIQYPGRNGAPIGKKLFSFLTSGNPLTWLFESVWFLCLGRVAASLAGDPSPELSTFSYGDDMVVRSQNYETTLQVLESFGHRVNTRKSYGTGHFRESCGGWFYDGTDVTPTFWPRREVRPKKAVLAASLVDLQHKAYSNNWIGVAEWLTSEVLALYPHITRSSIGSEFGDLWDPEIDEYYDSACKHASFTSEVKEHSGRMLHLAEHIAYTEYLMYGPLYCCDEDRAWGISTSRVKALMRYPTGKVVLRR